MRVTMTHAPVPAPQNLRKAAAPLRCSPCTPPYAAHVSLDPNDRSVQLTLACVLVTGEGHYHGPAALVSAATSKAPPGLLIVIGHAATLACAYVCRRTGLVIFEGSDVCTCSRSSACGGSHRISTNLQENLKTCRCSTSV